MDAPEIPFAPLRDSCMDARVAPNVGQRFYLWDALYEPVLVTDPALREGLVPVDVAGRPTISCYPFPPSVRPRGAVVLCGGGGFVLHGNATDCHPAALQLTRLGWRCFVVDYRLQPYTQAEAAVDLARAVRFVRAHSAEYRVRPSRIACLGFAAGGLVVGECMLRWAGKVTPLVLDPLYACDALDEVSANVYAVGLAYAFYGQPGVADRNVAGRGRAQLPRTYYCWGAEDPLAAEYAASADAAERAGVRVKRAVLPRRGAGFGTQGAWLRPFSQWLSLP